MSQRDHFLDASALLTALALDDRQGATVILDCCDRLGVLIVIANLASTWLKDGCDLAGMDIEEELAGLRAWSMSRIPTDDA